MPTKPKKTTPAKLRGQSPSQSRLYTLEVILTGGPISEKFATKNPVISRTIQMRGDQTLEELHYAIFDAFGRDDEHMYEFQLGKRPMDPKAPRYVMPVAYDMGDDSPSAGSVDQTTLDSLNIAKGRTFCYWFDFGDDWWHQIKVEAIDDKVPTGKFPRVTKRVGKSPPQYADYDE